MDSQHDNTTGRERSESVSGFRCSIHITVLELKEVKKNIWGEVYCTQNHQHEQVMELLNELSI